MNIERSYDIENVVREALSDYFNIYCRPLPKNFKAPSLLVTVVGGFDDNKIDNFDIVLDSRAKTESESIDQLLDAIATLKEISKNQNTAIRHILINSIVSWGNDPIRPDLAMCSTRLKIYIHKYNKIINKII